MAKMTRTSSHRNLNLSSSVVQVNKLNSRFVALVHLPTPVRLAVNTGSVDCGQAPVLEFRSRSVFTGVRNVNRDPYKGREHG